MRTSSRASRSSRACRSCARSSRAGLSVRIACLSTDPGIAWGGAKGASVHLAEIVEALREEGVEVLVLVSGIAAGGAGAVPWRHARVASRPAQGNGRRRAPGRRGAARRLARRSSAARSARMRCTSASRCTRRPARRPRARSGSRTSSSSNAPLPEEAARYRRLERAETRPTGSSGTTLSRADLVLPVSSPLAAYAPERGARRVEVTPNAVVPERFADLPARDPSAPPARRLLRRAAAVARRSRRSPRPGRCSTERRLDCG